MVEIKLIDGKIKFIRHFDDTVMAFDCFSLQKALAYKMIWEINMLN